MNKATSDEAMKLALAALTESVDLVANELEDYKNLYSRYPSRAARMASMQKGLDAHRNAIAQLVAILAADATQPPQDERGQGDCGNAECGWRGPISECSYLGSVGPCCPKCREIVEPDVKPAQPVALSTLTEICQRCKGSGIVDDGEINCFEDGTPFENGPVKCVKDCPACAASTPSAVATPSPEALVEQYLADLISRSPDPLRELGDYLGRVLDEDEFPTAERYVLAAMKASLATPPQPVAAEVAIAPKLLLERAAEMCEWYAEFIRENVMSVDIERHPYRPELEGIAEDLRALSGTGSDESKKESGNGL